MGIFVQSYQTNVNVGRVVDQSGSLSNATLKNIGPSPIFVNPYYGSSSDGGSDTVNTGSGFPILPGESQTFTNAKLIIQPSSLDVTYSGASTFWGLFF